MTDNNGISDRAEVPPASALVVAALLVVLAAYLLAMAVTIATTMISMLLEGGGFLGLEPELLIPLGIGAVAVSLLVMARRLLAPPPEV